jgi:predicted  nucleic acid-binding Zn-ribbon protein
MDIKITTQKTKMLKCGKCGHTWKPRGVIIKGCPKCKYGYYKARVIKRLKEKADPLL